MAATVTTQVPAQVPAQDPTAAPAVVPAKVPTVAARSVALGVTAASAAGMSQQELSAVAARCKREINWAAGQAAKENLTRKDHIGRKDGAVAASLSRRTAAYSAVLAVVLPLLVPAAPAAPAAVPATDPAK